MVQAKWLCGALLICSIAIINGQEGPYDDQYEGPPPPYKPAPPKYRPTPPPYESSSEEPYPIPNPYKPKVPAPYEPAPPPVYRTPAPYKPPPPAYPPAPYADDLPEPPIWTYTKGKYGPSNWGLYWPRCSNGQIQAPVNIETGVVIPGCWPEIELNGWGNSLKGIILTNGYRAAAITPAPHCDITLEGGPLPVGSTYHLLVALFHVGEDDSLGSDNAVDGKKTPLELCAVFATDPDADWHDADSSAGFLVVEFGVVISTYDNEEWQPIIDGLHDIVQGGTSTHITLESLKSIFPKDWSKDYYTTVTSFSVPPCTENVIKIYSKKVVQLSKKQVAQFRYINDEKGYPVTNNFRPLQNNAHRQIVSVGPRSPLPY